ncbi:Harpin-induced protein 1 containing protein, expressed [Panicum miliaceum]|uniref:Harpin-induced protein 1 containing protein, expressed n=1 Tax=Panicum miliaceum TaxID=4540 RepID=A0A3L6SUW4_PANMI|nr:Harpin-induced protein 1 containing protein, expressed [Panicum miliaceum]
MADRVHPVPAPPSRRPDQPPADADAEAPATGAAGAAATETTPLHPSFNRPPSPPAGTYIIQVPKDQVLRVPPPDRARRYKKLAARPARRRLLRRACCCSFAALLLLLLLAAAFAGAVYLIFRPRAPTFSVASLSIRGLDAALISSSSALSPELDAAVRADNGANRKVGVDYRGGGSVTVSYAGQRLAAGP